MNPSRRALLAGVAGLTGLAGFDGMVPVPVASAGSSRKVLRVGVVGAGILGAAIALELAERGAAVTLLDAVAPAAGATRNSYAWLNACVGDARYRDLRLASLARWRELDARYGLGIRWGGYLQWATDPTNTSLVDDTDRWLAGSSAPARRLRPGDLSALAPYLTPGDVAAAVLVPSDGHLDPVAVTERLVALCRSRGVDVRYPESVRGIEFQSGRLRKVATNRDHLRLDRLVIAAGTATPSLAEMAGARFSLQHAPGILVHTRPLPVFTRLLHEGPREASFKQFADGRIVAYDAPHPPDLPAHAGIRLAPMDFPSTGLRRQHGLRMLSRLARLCPRLQSADFANLTLGFRPMPPDDRPIVGALRDAPDVHVAVTHSGVTLAAILAQCVADEVVIGGRRPELAAYRPERFA